MCRVETGIAATGSNLGTGEEKVGWLVWCDLVMNTLLDAGRDRCDAMRYGVLRDVTYLTYLVGRCLLVG